GQPTIERQTEVPYGWGLPGEVIPIKVPSVNVRSVGAGGGSIAHVPEVTGAYPVIVPPAPGLLCATGDLVADFRGEFARTFIRTVDSVTGDELKGILDDLGSEAQQWLE